MLGTSPDNAKMHASRARRRIGQTNPSRATTVGDTAVVDAFLAAAAGGDIERMLALMTDDCARTADPALTPTGTPAVVTGAFAVAEETALFADRIRTSIRMLVGGRPAHVIAPGGHPLAVVDIISRNGLITRIDISRTSARTSIAMPSATS